MNVVWRVWIFSKSPSAFRDNRKKKERGGHATPFLFKALKMLKFS